MSASVFTPLSTTVPPRSLVCVELVSHADAAPEFALRFYVRGPTSEAC
ncbi:hypothetical protein HMPREF1861_01807 [Corynebacterium kroppenstedtii]|nr:hypothetical protein HMPREF1861_01807 [Corynebacterium kroppenstedtii]